MSTRSGLRQRNAASVGPEGEVVLTDLWTSAPCPVWPIWGHGLTHSLLCTTDAEFQRASIEQQGDSRNRASRAQKPCESRDGRPGLPSLISLMVSVDVKHHE